MKKLVGDLNTLFYSSHTFSLLSYPTTTGLTAKRGYYVSDSYCTIIMGGTATAAVTLTFPTPKTVFDLVYTSNGEVKTVTGFSGTINLTSGEVFEINAYYEVK